MAPAESPQERGRGSWAGYRGRAIGPLVREALKLLLPNERLGEARYVGGYWNRRGDVEVDLVGASKKERPDRVDFVGSIKWRDAAIRPPGLRRPLRAARRGSRGGRLDAPLRARQPRRHAPRRGRGPRRRTRRPRVQGRYRAVPLLGAGRLRRGARLRRGLPLGGAEGRRDLRAGPGRRRPAAGRGGLAVRRRRPRRPLDDLRQPRRARAR